MSLISGTSVLLTLVFAYLIKTYLFRPNIKNKDGKTLPPGPLLRYPYLGKYSEKIVHGWAQKYGPIFSVYLGSQPIVFINDPIVARDLLISNGTIFSGRWNYFMKNQTILQRGAVTASPYNDRWRQQRKIAMWRLGPKVVTSYGSTTLDYETHIFMKSLFKTSEQGTLPIDPAVAVGRFAVNNMLTLAFGIRTYTSADSLVQTALELGLEFNQLTGPLANAIDFIEPLQWIPTSTRTRGRNLRDRFVETYGKMITQVKERMDNGEVVPDGLVKSMLEHQEEENLSITDMSLMVVAFMTGGYFSTSVTLQRFIAVMACYPDVQLKAHAELDAVMGRHSWPSAEDDKKLPYIRAIIKEILRIHPPFWMGTPHCSDADFVYRGMFIPKNTTVILNSYSIHHNEERYPDPWTFNPDRYMGDNLTSSESANQSDPLLRDHWAFGAGRRICPGIHIAERSIFLSVVRFLWCFNVVPIPEEPISLEEYKGLSGRSPNPYRVKIEARHGNVQSLLEEKEEQELAAY